MLVNLLSILMENPIHKNFSLSKQNLRRRVKMTLIYLFNRLLRRICKRIPVKEMLMLKGKTGTILSMQWCLMSLLEHV
jgi:hypothetical protein